MTRLAAGTTVPRVIDESGNLAGIVTEEDFLRWATAHMAPAGREVHAA